MTPFDHTAAEEIPIVRSRWAWHHFAINLLRHGGRWHVSGGWQLSILGTGHPFDLDLSYPTRPAAILNYAPRLRDEMIRRAGHRDPRQLREATTIATKVNAWLETYRATHRTPSPQQLEFAFS